MTTWREMEMRVGHFTRTRTLYSPHCNTDPGGQTLCTWCRIRWRQLPGSCICPEAQLAVRCSPDASVRNLETSLWLRISAATLLQHGLDRQLWSVHSRPWEKINKHWVRYILMTSCDVVMVVTERAERAGIKYNWQPADQVNSFNLSKSTKVCLFCYQSSKTQDYLIKT